MTRSSSLAFVLVCAIAVASPASAASQTTPTSPDDALVAAIAGRDLEAAGAALANGANVNRVDPAVHAAPLGMALVLNQPAMATLFLEHGADPNVVVAIKELRVPALIVAVKTGDAALVSTLLQHRADA